LCSIFHSDGDCRVEPYFSIAIRFDQERVNIPVYEPGAHSERMHPRELPVRQYAARTAEGGRSRAEMIALAICKGMPVVVAVQ